MFRQQFRLCLRHLWKPGFHRLRNSLMKFAAFLLVDCGVEGFFKQGMFEHITATRPLAFAEQNVRRNELT
jgi:hypothetical protein